MWDKVKLGQNLSFHPSIFYLKLVPLGIVSKKLTQYHILDAYIQYNIFRTCLILILESIYIISNN